MTHARTLLACVFRDELGPPYSAFDLIPLPRHEIVRLRRHYPQSMAHLLELVQQRVAGTEPTTTPRRRRAKTTERRTS